MLNTSDSDVGRWRLSASRVPTKGVRFVLEKADELPELVSEEGFPENMYCRVT